MINNKYTCHKISEGHGKGEVIFSSDPINFYLVDPKTGIFIEPNHSLNGKCISGKVVVFPYGKASSVVQADGMFQLMQAGTGPTALVIKDPDTTLVASAIILEYPMVDRVDPEFYNDVKDGDMIEVDADTGIIRKL